MALRRTLSKRLFSPTTPQCPLPVKPLQQFPSPPPPENHRHRPPISPDTTSTGFFLRFLQSRTINKNALPSSFFSLPVGDKFREKLQSVNIPGRQLPRLDKFPPAAAEDGKLRLSAADAKKVMKFMQLEVVRDRLRNIPASTVPYSEFLRVCDDAGGSREELAKALDECGNVIVLGGVVFLRPDQVAKSIETLIWQSTAMPNDPRRAELENLEHQKSLIDEKGRSIVRVEPTAGWAF